jgi:hypothetical protein
VYEPYAPCDRIKKLKAEKSRQGRTMMQERKICAVVREEYWITELEQQFILAYRNSDQNIQHAVNRLLEVEENFENETE